MSFVMRAVSLACLLCLLHSSQAQESKLDFDVQRDCEITRNIGGYNRIDVDLGNLPLASQGHVKLVVQNPFAEDIQLGIYFSG